MNALLLAWLGACTTSAPTSPTPPSRAGTFPKTDLATNGDGTSIQLYLEPWVSKGTYTLAEPVMSSEGPHIKVAALSGRKVSIIPLHVQLDGDARKTIGTDLVLTADGTPLRYGLLGGGNNSWRLVKDRLEVKAKGKKTVTITYLRSDDLLKRRSPSKSGLEPHAFVQATSSYNGDTRPALMLPASSKAVWTLTVPPNGIFRGYVGLERASGSEQSDGMAVALTVDGVEVDRAEVKAEPMDKWTFDLSKWSGKEVELGLDAISTGTPNEDTVLVSTPTVVGPAQKVRRVLVVGFDTTRPDHLGWYGYDKDTTPELDQIANTSAVFTHSWTPAPRTRPSFRSATTGRYPLEAVGATNIGEVFQRNGFATAGFVANIHLQPRFDFDHGFDLWFFDGQSRVHKQVDKTLAFFEANADRDAYVFMHVMDPHLAYRPPAPYDTQFVDQVDPDLPRGFTKGMVKSWGSRGQLSDTRKAHIVGLYDGELAYTSAQIGRLVQALDALPGETLVVFHSDHGEEFWEHGGFEHNHTLYDEVTRALLWVRPPGGTRDGAVVSEHPATLADIAPTLYDFMGFQELPETDGISLRPWLEGAPAGQRDIGIAHLRHGVDQWGVVHDGHKYILHPGTGREELYALPNEQVDLSKKTDLAPYRQALVGAHPGLEGGLGWRLQLQDMSAFTLHLPKRAKAAGLLDPDTYLATRPNLSWGEKAVRTAEEVGGLSLSDDGMSVSFVPGTRPTGIGWVRFDEEVGLEKTEVELGGTRSLYPTARGVITGSGGKLRAKPGMIIVPPPGEAARMARSEDRSTEETCRLCELGYIEGESCKACL